MVQNGLRGQMNRADDGLCESGVKKTAEWLCKNEKLNYTKLVKMEDRQTRTLG